MNRRYLLRGAGALLALRAVPVLAQPATLPKPGPRDLCPVCGMVVSKYPEWTATIVWRDGMAQHFDGPKDLFKLLLNLGRYAPARRREDVTTVTVTEYYDLKRIDATKALYVIGSGVMGPMGHELIALNGPADAREFTKDHGGRRTLRFDEVDAALLARLDAGSFS